MMDKLAVAMGGEGQYVTMVAFLSSTSHNQWMDAAVAYQKEAYPNMELIPEERIECEDNMDMELLPEPIDIDEANNVCEKCRWYHVNNE